MVRQLLTDLEEVEEVNKQLDQMYVAPLLSLLLLVAAFPWPIRRIFMDDGAS